MEAVATSAGKAALSALFRMLFDRLASFDLKKYIGKRQVLDKLEECEKMLIKLHAVLEDAEEKQITSRLVKIWVTELSDLAYDLEDVVDELATKAEKIKFREEHRPSSSKVRKFLPACCLGGMSPSTVKFNAEMTSKIEEIAVRLQKITTEQGSLGLEEGGIRTKQMVSKRLPTTSLVNEAIVYGREKDKEEVLKLLKSEADGRRFSVVSIIGMGGVGKTTLAQLVFNDDGLEFDFKVWVSVGEVFDVTRITKTILQLEGAGDKDLNSLQVELKERLSRKKFLIVLDDVWNENYDSWTLFSGPFEAGALGSKIVVTTRHGSVALLMGGSETYHLNQLPYNHCLSVFAQHALGVTNFVEYSDLEHIGTEIVKRCQGLPLAAKALGGLLRGNLNPKAWTEVLTSKIWAFPEEKNNILPALKVSYHHLPSHLKRCFAYCAIFPKGYEFEKNELVLLWMAEGFLDLSKGKQKIEEVGYEYFDNLLSRSFFQQSSSNVKRYVMHDLMNDLAQSIGGGKCFAWDEMFLDRKSYVNLHHSSFISGEFDVSVRFEVLQEMKSLRTFLALPVKHMFHQFLSSKVLNDFVPKLKRLRTLSLVGYGFAEIPDSIGDLKHLRYFNLSCTPILRLPRSLGKLFNLQTLLLRSCTKLKELPTSIGNLANLQFLDLRGTIQLQKMPCEIGYLTTLRLLPKFIVGKENGLGIIKLRELSNLQGELHILGLHNVKHIREAEHCNMEEKHGVDAFHFEWKSGYNGSQDVNRDLLVLESLKPPQNIRSLSITSYGGLKFPFWLGNPTFSNIVGMKLCGCLNIISLPPLGCLPSLRDLSLTSMVGLKRVDTEFYGDVSPSFMVSFPSLETFFIQNMPKWEEWCLFASNGEAVGTFPRLRKLRVTGCRNLVGKLPSHLPSLEVLSIQGCPALASLSEKLPSLVELDIDSCQVVALKSVGAFTNLTTLKLRRIPGLVSLHEGLSWQLTALKVLEIESCDELKYLWRDEIESGKVALLELLIVEFCPQLVSLVASKEGLQKLTSLKHLKIHECKEFVSLGEGEDGLLPPNLEFLALTNCDNLEKLPNALHNLKCLQDLTIQECEKLSSLSAASLPSTLESFTVQYCSSVESLPKGLMCDANDDGSKKMSHLERLSVARCPSLTFFPTGEIPHSLRRLSIGHGMMHLLSKPLMHLTRLVLIGCDELECFPDSDLPIPTLVYLRLIACRNLKCLPNGMHELTSLKELMLWNCDSLTSFPKCGLPTKLNSLVIETCRNLSQPMAEWRLHRLTSLQRLTISGTSPSTDVISFPDSGVSLPASLTYLSIGVVDNLKFIGRGIRNLPSLRGLSIWYCPNLQSLPKEGLPPALGRLSIYGCPTLKKRCLRGKGEYWPIIANIPCVDID